MGCMKSTLSDGLGAGVEEKISQQTVRTEQTHYVRDPTSSTKNNIVSSETAGLSEMSVNKTLISRDNFNKVVFAQNDWAA